uniref:Transcription factor TFIIIC triple barrel domain-containing protein n=1 Tax=Panagrolaimus sp. JU765 TaxID=591449 RepID=A0AC34QLW6_9BILA
MPPKNSKSTKQSESRSKQKKTTFEDILANVPLPPPPMVKPSRAQGQASNLDDSQLESEVLIQDQLETEPETSNDNDWQTDDETEDQLVVVEVTGFIDPAAITEKINLDLVSVRHPESETPTIQIGGQLFAGKYKETDGSIMVLEEHQEADNTTFTLEGITDVMMDARKTYLFAKGADESQPGEELRKPIELRNTQKANKALSMNIRKKL